MIDNRAQFTPALFSFDCWLKG